MTDAAVAPKKSKKSKDKVDGIEKGNKRPAEDGEDGERKKKKRKEREKEGLDANGDDGESDRKKKKKEKKRKDAEAQATEKFGADNETSEVAPATEKKKKDKKRKRVEDAEQASGPTPSTSTPAESSSSTPQPETKKKKTGTFSTLAPPTTPAEASAFLQKHSITITTPPVHSSLPPVTAFPQLAIPDKLRGSFKGFTEPTPIQACAWPHALLGRDVVGIAETGSGKTLAFGIPALAQLLSSPTPPRTGGTSTVSVLVVAPTRELALQTQENLAKIGESLGIGSVAVFGGVPKGQQIQQLRNLHKEKTTTRIIVGTPGRILDLVQEGVCDLSGVNYLVLDEADRMLDKGFENDIRNIIAQTKQGKGERQTMMFSATWPDAVRRLASTFQQDPVRVTVGSDDLTANSRVEQVVEVFDDSRSKDSRLLGLLRSLGHKKGVSKSGDGSSRILVFALYKKEASRVEQRLRQEGYSVGALHGDLSQSARLDALEKFKNGTTLLLVATDVAARGLDIPDVEAVINYTFPLTIEDYIHRIGRTGTDLNLNITIWLTHKNHERSIAGELARVLRESGFECEGLKKFPMTIKKKEHGAYGAFFRDDIPMPSGPTKIVFE
ncbi:DEAD-domain-containing protein [Mycena amicta]|nr:DEAD-domain-containing protein [Mycena amicta]